MDILPVIMKPDPSKAETEQVQLEKQEYKLIGSFLRTRGLRLFVYDIKNDVINEMPTVKKTTIATALDPETGFLVVNDKESKEKCQIDSTNIPFEALNLANAEKRLRKYKEGKIKYLCNLVPTSSQKRII